MWPSAIASQSGLKKENCLFDAAKCQVGHENTLQQHSHTCRQAGVSWWYSGAGLEISTSADIYPADSLALCASESEGNTMRNDLERKEGEKLQILLHFPPISAAEASAVMLAFHLSQYPS